MAESQTMGGNDDQEDDKPEADPQKVKQELLTNKPECDDVRDPHYGWVVVFASFIAHMMFFGINLSFGVIYIFLLEYYNHPRGETAWIGSIPTGLVSLMSPFAGFLTNKYGCRPVVICGSLIASSGFIISSFVTSMSYLYFTYSVLIGVGQGLMCIPSKIIVNVYMRKRRGLANAICSSGGGGGVIVISSLYASLHHHYSLRGLFLVMGAVVLHAAICGTLYRPLQNPRERRSHVEKDALSASSKRKRKRFCGNICQLHRRIHSGNLTFTMFLCACFLSGLGALVPYVHLPRKARDHGLPEYEIAWLLPLIGATSVVGRLLFGCLIDTWGHVIAIWSWSTIACGVSLLLCPIITSFPFLIVFSVIFGTFTGVWIGMVAVVVVDMVGIAKLSNSLGIVQFLLGCAMLVGPPLAGWLFDLTGTYDSSFYASGVLFVTSGFMVLTALQLAAKKLLRSNGTIDVN